MEIRPPRAGLPACLAVQESPLSTYYSTVPVGAGTSLPLLRKSCFVLCKSRWIFKVILQHVQMPPPPFNADGSRLAGPIFGTKLFLPASTTRSGQPGSWGVP